MSHPLILAGAGHAHLVAVRRWIDAGWRAPAGTLLINPTGRAWYSGMMPGLLAGRFREQDCAIDLLPLCEAAGITLRIESVESLAPARHTLSTETIRPGFDVLSINCGSRPPGPTESDGSIACIPAKPFPVFVDTWRHWRAERAPARLAILGGGPAAFELALALRASFPQTSLQLLSHNRLLAGHPPRLAERALDLLQVRGIGLLTGQRIDRIRDGQLYNGETPVAAADALVLASGAAPLDWYADSGLDTKEGFLQVDGRLQAINHPRIFAAGDSIQLPGALHSGVYAVRQGATLAENIPALLEGRALHTYHPQPRALSLLATADGGALLSYGRWTAQGRLPGLWKDHLDTTFMKRHRL
jgi:NADH dehydrogenase FAD-containing subunit